MSLVMAGVISNSGPVQNKMKHIGMVCEISAKFYLFGAEISQNKGK